MICFREFLNEHAICRSIPYSNDAYKTFEKITKDIPNPHDYDTLYYCKETHKLYFKSNKGFLNVIFLETNVVGTKNCVGFFVKLLTKKDTFKDKELNLWYKPISEFTSKMKSQSDADKFYNKVVKAITNMSIKTKPDADKVFEKIEEIFNS